MAVLIYDETIIIKYEVQSFFFEILFLIVEGILLNFQFLKSKLMD